MEDNKNGEVCMTETMVADESMEEMIRQYRGLVDSKEEINNNLKEVNGQMAILKDLIIAKMQGEGVDKVSTSDGSASIKTDIYPQVTDFPAFLTYVVSHRAWELTQKRVNQAPYRAAVLEGIEIPGLGEYEDTKLNFRRK